MVRTILVTGGTGLLGSALRSEVNEADSPDTWHFTSSIDADLCDKKQTRDLFDRIRPTHVIHLAATSGGLYKNLRNQAKVLHDNTAIDDNVLQCCHTFNVTKTISCLTTSSFPDAATYPLDESMLHNGKLHAAHLGAGTAKRRIDVLNHCYRNDFHCHFTAVIPTNVYGPNDNFDIIEGHVIPSLIHKAHVAKEQNYPLLILGSGLAMRQFIYSKDVAKLLLWALDNYDHVDPILFTGSHKDEVSIRELALSVAHAVGFHGPIHFDTTYDDGPHRKTCSNKKLLRHVPDFTFTSLSQGLRETVAWYRQQNKINCN